MAKSTYIKCSNCGVFNTDKEYCENCGELISHEKKQELKAQQVQKEILEEAIEDFQNPNLPERLKKHPNFFVKVLGWILFSIWMTVSLIGAFLAWFIAMVAAG